MVVTSAVAGVVAAGAAVAGGVATYKAGKATAAAAKESAAAQREATAASQAAIAKQESEQARLAAEEKRRIDADASQANLIAARDLAASRFRTRTAAQARAASTILTGNAVVSPDVAAPSSILGGSGGRTLLGG